MDLVVNGSGTALWKGRTLRCAIGRGGISAGKREGDGATPAGRFPMRFLLFRPDRLGAPPTGLPRRAIERDDGWCDAPTDHAYNSLIRLPYSAHAEALWRADEVYDLVVPLGYNDMPVMAGLGSAIFLHVATADFAPTAGCIALAKPDLLAVLAEADQQSCVVTEA
jgi:L,D-peptidoglycan transpeptidase YkuD (ErfK/YbiS/YcfS/YnhG family)